MKIPTLQLRFNRQYTQKADAESLPETGVRLNVKDFLFSIVKPVPHDLVIPVTVGFQLQPEGLFFDVLIEPFRQLIGDFLVFVPDVTPAKNGHLIIDGKRLVVHAARHRTGTRHELGDSACFTAEGIK